MNQGLYEHLAHFVAIARAGSFTGAAASTGVAQATLSRQLAALERHLGCALFNRSTRAISLTEAGEVLLAQAQPVLDAMRDAQQAVRPVDAPLRGRVRVSCSHALGRLVLIPSLRRWHAAHPDTTIELQLSDEAAPLVAQGLDVAFRLGSLQASGLVARPLAQLPRVCVASQGYLRQAPSLHTPQDLRHHQCLLLTARVGAQAAAGWTFTDPEGRTVSVPVTGRVQVSTMDALRDAVVAGLGVAITPAWFWGHSPDARQVRVLLSDHRLPPQRLSAITPHRPRRGGEVDRFIDFVADTLKDQGQA